MQETRQRKIFMAMMADAIFSHSPLFINTPAAQLSTILDLTSPSQPRQYQPVISKRQKRRNRYTGKA